MERARKLLNREKQIPLPTHNSQKDLADSFAIFSMTKLIKYVNIFLDLLHQIMMFWTTILN